MIQPFIWKMSTLLKRKTRDLLSDDKIPLVYPVFRKDNILEMKHRTCISRRCILWWRISEQQDAYFRIHKLRILKWTKRKKTVCQLDIRKQIAIIISKCTASILNILRNYRNYYGISNYIDNSLNDKNHIRFSWHW